MDIGIAANARASAGVRLVDAQAAQRRSKENRGALGLRVAFALQEYGDAIADEVSAYHTAGRGGEAPQIARPLRPL